VEDAFDSALPHLLRRPSLRIASLDMAMPDSTSEILQLTDFGSNLVGADSTGAKCVDAVSRIGLDFGASDELAPNESDGV
jgi:hypothetical protein